MKGSQKRGYACLENKKGMDLCLQQLSIPDGGGGGYRSRTDDL